MITITKNITITIDKGDVPVLKNICEMARRYEHHWHISDGEFKTEQMQEIHKFLNIIFERVK